MTAKRLLVTALIATAPAAALAFTRVGVGLNFGFPVYDYPAPSRVVVVQQPAATEVLPPSPGPDYVWINGRWEWDTAGNRWVWYSGSWQKPPTPTAIWQAGYWSQKGPAWSWVGSHWSIPNPAATTPPPPAMPSAPPAAPQTAPAAAAPGAAPSPVVVNEAPPPPIVEQIYTSPGPDYVWIPGYWNWNGAWVWVSGRYALPPLSGRGLGGRCLERPRRPVGLGRRSLALSAGVRLRSVPHPRPLEGGRPAQSERARPEAGYRPSPNFSSICRA